HCLLAREREGGDRVQCRPGADALEGRHQRGILRDGAGDRRSDCERAGRCRDDERRQRAHRRSAAARPAEGPAEEVRTMTRDLGPERYWVARNTLVAGEYPASSSDAEARERIAALLDDGVRSFVDLTESDDWKAYDTLLAVLAEERGV